MKNQNSQGKITVIIADDHPFIRLGLREMLERSQDILVVGEACNGREAVRMVEELTPDVLLLDLQMPVMDGVEVMDALLEKKSHVRIVILSAIDDIYFIYEAFLRGACGYYLKEDAPQLILEAIRKAQRGEMNGLSPRIASRGISFIG